MSLTFGIDFDGTISADPELFSLLIPMMWTKGHKTVIITSRSATGRSKSEVQEILDEWFTPEQQENLPVLYAGSEWKHVAAQNAGYKVSIWIDDNPLTIMESQALHLFSGGAIQGLDDAD